MKESLAKIAAKVDAVLRSDSFPSAILPNCLKEAVLAYPSRGGKRIRPAITQWFCGIFNENPAKALYPACAIEIFHTWTLVHDDIIDNDSTRRGADSAHEMLRKNGLSDYRCSEEKAVHFGKSFAILAGDLQQAWVISLMLKLRSELVWNETLLAIIDRLVNHLYSKLLSGEAIDVEFEHRPLESITEDEILGMLRWKTGELLRFAAETGVVIGLNLSDYDHEYVQFAGEYALQAGLAFQLQDDILGIYGNEKEFGKPVGNDLRERKVTLLIKKALLRSTAAEKEFLLNCLGSKNLTDVDLNRARVIIRQCGALNEVEEMAKECIEKAKKLLKEFPANSYRNLLEQLADFLIQRKY